MEATQNGRTGGAGAGPLVMVRTEDGFRVYSPANPGQSYTVSGSPENPTCSCPEFQHGRKDERCVHISAVLNSFPVPQERDEDRYAAEERRAIQGEGRAGEDHGCSGTNGATQMLIKRSVSPDGRIDSLSVEFSTGVDGMPVAHVTRRAAELLALQSGIVQGFLAGAKNGNGTKPKDTSDNGVNGAALAEMVDIGGMDGRWGRRLFIRIQANGQSLRLYGSKPQLVEAIKNAGFARAAERIEEGVALRVPCRVITKPSPDGKYVNIERVLPVQAPETNGGAGR